MINILGVILIKFVLTGIFILVFLYIAGLFPPITVAMTAIGITFLFLVFGGE